MSQRFFIFINNKLLNLFFNINEIIKKFNLFMSNNNGLHHIQKANFNKSNSYFI